MSERVSLPVMQLLVAAFVAAAAVVATHAATAGDIRAQAERIAAMKEDQAEIRQELIQLRTECRSALESMPRRTAIEIDKLMREP